MEWSTTGATPSEPHFENGNDYGGKLRRWQRSRLHSHDGGRGLKVEPDRTTAEVDDLLKQLDNYWKSSKDYYDDDEHCRGRNYFWDAPDLQCD